MSVFNYIDTVIPPGTWIVRARAIGASGIPGGWNQNPVTVDGKPWPLGALQSLTSFELVMGIRLVWAMPTGFDVLDAAGTEIRVGTSNNLALASFLAEIAYPTATYTFSANTAGEQYFFWARLTSKSGNDPGPWIGPVVGTTSTDATAILAVLTGKIESSQLAQDLRSKIDSIDDLQSFIEPPTAWDAGDAYANGSFVSHNGRLWLALDDLPEGGAEPGTDPEVWRDVGAVAQTAAGLALQMSNINVTVEDLDGQVQATAEKTDSVYAQLNPKKIGAETGGTIGGQNDLPVTAGYFSQTLAQVSDNKALGKRLTTVQAQFGAQLAGVTTQIDTLADGQEALASQVTTVQSTAGAAQASAQLAVQTATNVDGKVSSAIVAKVGITSDGKYYPAGWALGVDNSGGTVQSAFYVTVDTFAILPTAAGGNAVAPFIVQGNQVFLNQAFIGTGFITNAMIGNQIASTAVNGNGQPVWEINKSGTRYVRGNQFTITEDVNGWRMTSNTTGVVVVEIGNLS